MNPRPAAIAVLVSAALVAGCSTVPSGFPDDRLSSRKFRSPVAGTVSSGFGNRPGGRHEGIDIPAPIGTPVLSAERGVVAYAGSRMRGYGNLVILDHGDGIRTLYGHLDTILVEANGIVAAGEAIGTVGRTGNATTPHLHFELRIDGVPMDPSLVLPGAGPYGQFRRIRVESPEAVRTNPPRNGHGIQRA